MEQKIRTYDDFWLFYLRAHSHPVTRRFHYAGTLLALAAILSAIVFFRPGLILLAVVVGYGASWFGHFVIERNRPAAFSYPFWSFFSDLKMTWYWITGRLDTELARAEAAGAAPERNVAAAT